MKKIISCIIVGSVTLCFAILIGALFSIWDLKGTTGNLCLTCGIIAIMGVLTLNSVILLEQKNKVAFLSLGLILVSGLMILIMVWNPEKNDPMYVKITWSVASLSIIINTIVGHVLKLKKNMLLMQIISYIVYGITAVLIQMAIFVDIFTKVGGTLIIPSVLISLIFTTILSINSKKYFIVTEEPGYIKIKKTEYEALLNRIEELEEKLNNQ